MNEKEINFATIASLLLNLEKLCEIGQEKKCTRNQSTFWREMIDISCSTVQEVVENSFVVEGCLESLTAYKFYSNIGTSCQLSVVKFFRGHQKKIDQISYDCQLWQERKRDISVAKKVNRLSRLSTDFLGRDPLSKIKMYYQKIQVLHSFLGPLSRDLPQKSKCIGHSTKHMYLKSQRSKILFTISPCTQTWY